MLNNYAFPGPLLGWSIRGHRIHGIDLLCILSVTQKRLSSVNQVNVVNLISRTKEESNAHSEPIGPRTETPTASRSRRESRQLSEPL